MAPRKGRKATSWRAPHSGPAGALEALAFLLPLIVFSEVAARACSAHATLSQQGRVVAFHLLSFFFQLFGSTGVVMPAVAVVAILLGIHLVSRQPWRIRPSAVGWMYVQSIVLAVPLVLFNHWVRLTAGLSLNRRLGEAAMGIGAGIYEELVFRLVLISGIMMIGSDLLRRSRSWVLAGALVISAVLFAAHHHPPVGSEPFELSRFLFRTVAGLYLGTVFLVRGYGLAAGAHAAYNLIVLSLT